VIAFPVIATQIYKFIAPGLYKNERAAFLPFLVASPILFLMGAALVYFFFTPMVMWFFLAMQQVGGRRGADFAAAEGVGISQPHHDADLLLRPGVPACRW
jgi:Sec-independent protein secretion pathway component TatC